MDKELLKTVLLDEKTRKGIKMSKQDIEKTVNINEEGIMIHPNNPHNKFYACARHANITHPNNIFPKQDSFSYFSLFTLEVCLYLRKALVCIFYSVSVFNVLLLLYYVIFYYFFVGFEKMSIHLSYFVEHYSKTCFKGFKIKNKGDYYV